jgi:amino acid transporter
MGTLPGLASDPTPLASAAARFLGPVGAVLLTLGAVFSTLGNESGLVLAAPRILYAFSRAGQLPAALSRVHPQYQTPHVAVLVFVALAWLAALYGSFIGLVAVSAFARLVFSAATCLAIPVLRRRLPPAPFRVPGGLLIPLSATALSLWLLSGMDREQATAGGLALAAGLALYLVFAFRGRKTANIPS